jgi:hypothetical protein
VKYAFKHGAIHDRVAGDRGRCHEGGDQERQGEAHLDWVLYREQEAVGVSMCRLCHTAYPSAEGPQYSRAKGISLCVARVYKG